MLGRAEARPAKRKKKRRDLSTQPRVTGTVSWFRANKGYGFIIRDDGEQDVFLYGRRLPDSTMDADGIKAVPKGARLEFVVRERPKGPEARMVRLLDEPQPHRPRPNQDSPTTVGAIDERGSSMHDAFEPGPDGNASDSLNWNSDPREDRAQDGGTHTNG
ncbi:cold shock domain-containing protein [Nocardia cyriacigeorgica]|nr:cold shock domain-containing protein [Nocardia cyriacigeorgica]